MSSSEISAVHVVGFVRHRGPCQSGYVIAYRGPVIPHVDLARIIRDVLTDAAATHYATLGMRRRMSSVQIAKNYFATRYGFALLRGIASHTLDTH